MLLITQGQADGGLDGRGVRDVKGGGRGKMVSLSLGTKRITNFPLVEWLS